GAVLQRALVLRGPRHRPRPVAHAVREEPRGRGGEGAVPDRHPHLRARPGDSVRGDAAA
ncbi:unnamed protein product, partial [Heterosigma akashiwo]